jgi:hypothetical protein
MDLRNRLHCSGPIGGEQPAGNLSCYELPSVFLPAELLPIEFPEGIDRRANRRLVLHTRQEVLPQCIIGSFQWFDDLRMLSGDVVLLAVVGFQVVQFPAFRTVLCVADQAVRLVPRAALPIFRRGRLAIGPTADMGGQTAVRLGHGGIPQQWHEAPAITLLGDLPRNLRSRKFRQRWDDIDVRRQPVNVGRL